MVGRYLLCGDLAAGGMATVHVGRLVGPVDFSRTVAIKRLHPTFAKDASFVAMFLDEARITAQIRHPNVVPTLDVVTEGDELLVVMEYVEGETLARLWRATTEAGERVPRGVALSIVTQMLHGLHAAHEAKDKNGEPLGIVHRDVSPQNVIVGVDGAARVLDFGIAKAHSRAQHTQEGQVKGKLTYMAPEQLEGARVDRRTDVFAAGVVLWETLTGVRLFAAESNAASISRILLGRVDPPSKRVPGLPPALDGICMRALAPSPASRFATAEEMATAIENVEPFPRAREIGEWVQRTAGPALRERRDLVSRIERIELPPATSSRRSGSAHDLSSMLEEVSDARRRAEMPTEVSASGPHDAVREEHTDVAVATAVSKGGVDAALAKRRRIAAWSGLVVGVVSALAVTFGVVLPLVDDAADGRRAAASEARLHAAAPPHARAAHEDLLARGDDAVSTHSRSPRRRSASTPTRDCTIPYSVDADGAKHFFPECL